MSNGPFYLVHDQARQRAVEAVRTAEPGLVVTIKKPTRSGEQNAKFHAICEDIARSGVTFAGKRHDATSWKLLLVSGHAVATGDGAEIVAGLEGEMVNLRESTAKMTKARSSSLLEYCIAFCAQNGITLSENT